MAENTMTRVSALAQFNKLNGAFITVLGMVDDITLLNHDSYVYREISIDFENEIVIGNYDSYQVVAVAEQPLNIYEEHLNALARDKIVKVYPLEKQLSIIGVLLEQLATTAGVDCDDIKDMNDYIAEVKRANALRKAFYESDPDYQYLSTEAVDEMYSKMYEGGINQYATTVTNI